MGVCIVHHLGLGDQLMLNGMVRHLAEMDDVAVIVIKPHKESVEFMYRDIPRVKVLVIDDTSPKSIFEAAQSTGYEVLPLATYSLDVEFWKLMCHNNGDSKMGPVNPRITNWCHAVYNQAGVNIDYMRSKFKVDRDLERERAVMDKFGLVPGEYIFVHDGKDRKLNLNTNVKIFNADDHYKEVPNIFDYITIIENAKEVHCVHSCYNWLIELLRIGNPSKNFFYNIRCINPYDSVKAVFSDTIWSFKD